jgi:hypothetical protein
LGSTQAGALAEWLGAPWAMAIGAIVAGAVIIAIRLLRPEVFQPSQTSNEPAMAAPDISVRPG